MTTPTILSEVAAERARQDAKWGPPDPACPDGTGAFSMRDGRAVPNALVGEIRRGHAEDSKCSADWAAAEDRLTFRLILRAEIDKAFAEDAPALLRAELIKVASAAVRWIEAIDARATRSEA
jgi:hypothetical protein